MIVNPDVDFYTKTPNHRKAIRKTQKNNNLLKDKRIQNTEIYCRLSDGPVFIFILLGEEVTTPGPRQLCH